jgi:hypothetical protein
MLSIDPPTTLAYVILGLAVVFRLPRLGHSLLAFLRDLDDYRGNRAAGLRDCGRTSRTENRE